MANRMIAHLDTHGANGHSPRSKKGEPNAKTKASRPAHAGTRPAHGWHRELRRLIDALNRPFEFDSSYLAGYDAGEHGPNASNCDFRYYQSKKQKKEWARGNRVAALARAKKVRR